MSEVELKSAGSAQRWDVTREIAHLAEGSWSGWCIEAASECESHLMANSAPFQQEEIPL